MKLNRLSLFLISCLIAPTLTAQEVTFNWDNFIRMPIPPTNNKLTNSPQVLHFYRLGKNIWEHAESVAYINAHMQAAKILDSDADNMRYALDLVDETSGLILEFGVCTAKSINFIAALKPRSVIYGFDSFQGLPEDWTEFNVAKGTFGARNAGFVPPVLNNVKLYAGMFADVLPEFMLNVVKDQQIAFMHVDCDLYSSTKTIFDNLKNNIRPGTIIVFDEYFNYDGFQNHEFKAFQEFIAESCLSYEYLSFNQAHQQVTVKITAK